MKNCPRVVLSFVLVGLLSTTAVADLMVDITGTVGSGTTNWVFSGTEVAGADEDFDSGFLSDFASVWVDHGDMFNSGWTNTNITPPFGAHDHDLVWNAKCRPVIYDGTKCSR